MYFWQTFCVFVYNFFCRARLKLEASLHAVIFDAEEKRYCYFFTHCLFCLRVTDCERGRESGLRTWLWPTNGNDDDLTTNIIVETHHHHDLNISIENLKIHSTHKTTNSYYSFHLLAHMHTLCSDEKINALTATRNSQHLIGHIYYTDFAVCFSSVRKGETLPACQLVFVAPSMYIDLYFLILLQFSCLHLQSASTSPYNLFFSFGN